MRVYRVGTTYLDLDQVQSIGEPYLDGRGDCWTCVKIPVCLMFSNERNVTVSIEQYRHDWPKDPMSREQYDEYKRRQDENEDKHVDAEFLRVKYNIWKPFLDAWENKDKEEAFSNQFNP